MWWFLGGVGILAAAVFSVGFVQTRRFKTTTVRYRNDAIPASLDRFRIAQVSDYHDSPFRRHGQQLCDAIRAERPDIIVLTGDLFERRRPEGCTHAFSFVEQAVRIAPVFFVEGNHERRLKRYPQWRRMLIERGVLVLEDEAVTLFRDGDALRIVGMRQVFDTDALRALCCRDAVNLVLSHRCEFASQYRAAGSALVLTGHAHGGQVRLLGKGVYAPDQGLLPALDAGVYGLGKATLYVSRGIGNSIPAPRLFNTPEWNLIILSHSMDAGR